MFIQPKIIPSAEPGLVNVFNGYNHNKYVGDNEFYDMTNMCSDEYPLMRTRGERNCNLTIGTTEYKETHATFSMRTSIEERSYTLYTADISDVAGGDSIRTRIHIDSTKVRDIEFTYTFKNDREIGSATQNITVTDSNDYEYIGRCKAGTTKMTVSIKCTLKPGIEFNVDNISSSHGTPTVDVLNEQIRGICLKNNRLAYFVGTTLFYNGKSYSFKNILSSMNDDGISDVQVLSYNAYILIFPMGLYVNTLNDEYGYLGSNYNSTKCVVHYEMSTLNGGNITASTTKPENPNNGDYWIDTTEASKGLYQWSESTSMWVGISSTYIKISIQTDPETVKFPTMFEVGDSLYMNSPLTDINKGSVIVKKGEYKNTSGQVVGGWVIVKGFINGAITQNATINSPVYFKRKIPQMQFCCVSNNRVWGCYKGLDEDGEKQLNEIYASKLGDPKNWYCYEGSSTDSYALSIGDDQDFTGAITHDGYPMFFKENIVYKIYGTYPATYQLYTYNVRGIQPGSHRSATVMNGILFYKTTSDIVAFESGQLTNISTRLGNEKYHSAVAGVCLDKMYVSMLDEQNEPHMFVYDLENHIWCREDNLRIEEFTSDESGELYGRDHLKLYGFGNATDTLTFSKLEDEGDFDWSFTTGELGKSNFTKGYFRAVYLRHEAPKSTRMDVYVSVDRKPWSLVATLYGEEIIKMREFVIPKERCDSFRVKVEGHGECIIHNFGFAYEEGSTVR